MLAWTRKVAVVIVATLVLGYAVAGQDKPLTASDALVKLPASGATRAMAFAHIEHPTMYAIYITRLRQTSQARSSFAIPWSRR